MSKKKDLQTVVNGYLIQLKKTYSVFKLSTGLETAALIAWKQIVVKAMKTANIPARANIHQPICIL